MTFTTKVGKCDVPVREAHNPSLVWFDAGDKNNKAFGERGVFAFWAAVLKTGPRNQRKIWGRSLVVISCGDRFDRMQYEQNTAPDKDAREHYRKAWNEKFKRGKNIAYLRPCTWAEIHQWAATHYSDAQYVKWAIIDGKYYAGTFKQESVPAVKWGGMA